MSKWPGGWIPWIGNATCAGLATLAVVLVVVAIVGCSVTGGDEVVEVPPVVVILGSIPPLPPYACYNSCSEWDMHTIVIWTKNLYLGKGPHNIVCHTWLSYFQIISWNIPSFLKEKQLGTSNSNLVYRSTRKIITYSYIELIQIDSAICSVSTSVHVKSFPRKIK